MYRTLLTGIGLAALMACDPFSNLPQNGRNYLDSALWDADLASAADGLYARLPASGSLVRISPNGEWSEVDLDGAEPTRLVVTPDGSTVLAFAQYPACTIEDPRIETVQDCEEEDPDGLEWVSELHLVRDGQVAAGDRMEIGAHFNALAFSPDGKNAVAYLDFNQPANISVSGLLNLTEVLFIDLENSTATSVPVGFAADRILFTQDYSKAVVLSESKVVVVELESGNYDIQVTYHLSLDVDDDVRPKDAALTPDGTMALLTVENSGDLYALNLESESINIVDLDASPADMVVDSSADKTALVYSGRSQVDVLDHDLLDVETVDLDEPSNRLLQADGFAVLYNDSATYYDVYRLDLSTSDLVEYRVKNPVDEMQISPDQTRALAFTRPDIGSGSGAEGIADENWGVEILNLTSDSGASISLVSQSKPLGMAFSADGDTALVLLEGVDDLLQLNLLNGSSSEIELEDTPLGIGAFGESGFFITHDAALGLVSFFDPATGELTPVGQFASAGLIQRERELPRQEEN